MMACKLKLSYLCDRGLLAVGAATARESSGSISCLGGVLHSHHRHFWMWSETHVLYERIDWRDLIATHDLEVRRNATATCSRDLCSRCALQNRHSPIKRDAMSADDLSRNSPAHRHRNARSRGGPGAKLSTCAWRACKSFQRRHGGTLP